MTKGVAAEEPAARQDLWTYATATSALLHDIGQPITDQRVRLYDQQGSELGHWDPWADLLPAVAGGYRVEFVRERHYRFYERPSTLKRPAVGPLRNTNDINELNIIRRDIGFSGCILYRRVVHRPKDGATS